MPRSGILRIPGVRRDASAWIEQGAELRDPERSGRPVVEPFEPGHDDADVDEVPEAVLGDDVRLDVLAEWVVGGQDARQREEDAGDAEPRISQRPTERRQPPECESGVGDERVGVEHPDEHQVDEEPLDATLLTGQVLFPRYAETIDALCARYQVRAVGFAMKSRVAATPGVRGSTRAAEGERRCLADVAQQ